MKWAIIILLVIGAIMVEAQVKPNTITLTKLGYTLDNEQANVSYYGEYESGNIIVPYKEYSSTENSFNFIFDNKTLNNIYYCTYETPYPYSVCDNLSSTDRTCYTKTSDEKTSGDLCANSEKWISQKFNNVLAYQIDSTQTFERTSNPCVLAYDTGKTSVVINLAGQEEERKVMQYLDFCQILKKESNIYDEVTEEVTKQRCLAWDDPIDDLKCTKEETYFETVSTKKKRDYSFSLNLFKNKIVAEFTNIFDLDPEFVDDTDSNWNAGTM